MASPFRILCMGTIAGLYFAPSVELRLFWVLHDGIGLILTRYGLVFYVATYYIHSLWT
ncbi:hypothetical protein DAEQUDRAFT_725256 [Daedalea quercina L-15889]|uniref:Uncharacterized protein n=1 Tax=Daedalea quercina L-15889 TaxID=1314783 RepID=A0A165RFQ5_9APHY|nr:hypothetical protein DAEQUDRAFT_725256 [Daedalea quercina L-15889]